MNKTIKVKVTSTRGRTLPFDLLKEREMTLDELWSIIRYPSVIIYHSETGAVINKYNVNSYFVNTEVKEVIKEVEVVKEVEVIKEVEKEVIKEVPVEKEETADIVKVVNWKAGNEITKVDLGSYRMNVTDKDAITVTAQDDATPAEIKMISDALISASVERTNLVVLASNDATIDKNIDIVVKVYKAK